MPKSCRFKVAGAVQQQMKDKTSTDGCNPHYWWSGSQGTVSVSYVPGSLSVAANGPTSYSATANVDISLSVPLRTQGCAEVSTFGCHCDGAQSGTAEAQGTETLAGELIIFLPQKP